MMKERVDVLLVQQGFFDSREKAKRAVMAGLVYSNTERIDKPGAKLNINTPLQVKGEFLKYVSRGGLKLEKAIRCFQLSLLDKLVIDIGASTGGFTDCALQHGAKLVYSIDVGYGQLDWKLRMDSRVVVMERTNFRYIKASDLDHGLPNFACIDVSFISLSLILPVLFPLLESGSPVVALVKPQFEAGRELVGKKGVVKDKQVHRDVLMKVSVLAEKIGYQFRGIHFSPITGGEGNIEFLLHLSKEETIEQISAERKERIVKQVVEEAHQQFSN